MIRSRKGSVIVMTMFIIFFGAMLFFALELLHRSDLEIVTNQIQDLQALYCADAGIEHAIILLRRKKQFPEGNPNTGVNALKQWYGGGNPPHPCTAGSSNTYTVYALEEKADSNYSKKRFNYFLFYSCGTAGNFTRVVMAEVHRTLDYNDDDAQDNYVQILSWRETNEKDIQDNHVAAWGGCGTGL